MRFHVLIKNLAKGSSGGGLLPGSDNQQQRTLAPSCTMSLCPAWLTNEIIDIPSLVRKRYDFIGVKQLSNNIIDRYLQDVHCS